MSALHDALKTLGPANFSDVPLDHLETFLSDAFRNGQLIIDSVPIPAPSNDSALSQSRSRSNTTSSSASSASEISLSSARSSPPPSDVEALQKEWKAVKLNPKENLLGMGVYKLASKDGKGAWFARRSVHEGLGYTKWKKGLEREFPETMKVQGGPGEGNIRGIGGEKRVEYKNVEGVGKMEVYLLSAQFPGPTTPRDFVTMFLTSDQALSNHSGGETEVPRHFMVISKPCIHEDTAPREGYIRGQYESIEFIREIPIKKPTSKAASTTNLPTQGSYTRNRSSTLGKEAILRNATKHNPSLTTGINASTQKNASTSETELSPGEARPRGKTISLDSSTSGARGEEWDHTETKEDSETNPIEWIMVTRSDPGGSVPRFMVERGTPGAIVSDASKFLNWACSKDIEDFESDDENFAGDENQTNALKREHRHHHSHEKDLHNYQTNGHLAGLEEESGEIATSRSPEQNPSDVNGLYGMVAGAAGVASNFIAAHAPAVITAHIPGYADGETNVETNGLLRRESVSSISSDSSYHSFASAVMGNDSSSIKTTYSSTEMKNMTQKEKDLQKLEEKKRKLDEKLSKAREKEASKKGEDVAKEEEAIRKAEEKHEREVKKQEEKYKKEVEKLDKKKQKEERRAEDRRKKAIEKDEKTRILRELEEAKAEVGVLRKEKEILRSQVGDLQAENTALAARVGRMAQGEEVLREVRQEVGKSGRMRATSLKGLTRTMSFKSGSSGEKEKDNGQFRS